jgi:hypothetical protein
VTEGDSSASPSGDGMHRRQQLLGPGTLEQEPRGACAQCAEDVVVLLESRQDQHPGCGSYPCQHIGGADPVQVGHANIHQHHIRGQPARLFDGLAPGSRLANDLDVGVGGEQFDQPGAHQAVVVGDQDPRHRRRPP